MAIALCLSVAIVAGSRELLGVRGRPLHETDAERANRVGGELVDAVGNIWAV
jgi:ATP-binding cassette, subfamily B, bacterial